MDHASTTGRSSPPAFVLFCHVSHLDIVGNVIFAGLVARADFACNDGAAPLRSSHAQLFPLGNEFGFLSDHSPGWTIRTERRTNPMPARALLTAGLARTGESAAAGDRTG